MVNRQKKRPANRKSSNQPSEKTPQNRVIPKQQIKEIKAAIRSESFSGPLPPPQILAQYDQIHPGAADRIITMAEEQARHRRDLEANVLSSEMNNARLGLHYGLIIGLASVLGGVFCIASGFEVGGLIIGGTGLTGLVGVFVYGSRQRRKEREKRLKSMMANAGGD